MLRFALLATLVALPATAAPPVARLASAPDRPGWFACDAVSGPFVAFVAQPDAKRNAAITMVDRRSRQSVTQDFTVGDGDPGAGQIHWSLAQHGKQVGSIHGINSGMVTGSGPDALPPIEGITIGRLSLACRWLGDMRLLAIGRTRSIAVTHENGGFVYRSFDYARRGPAIEAAEGVTTNRPTLIVTGGTVSNAGDYRFTGNGYAFLISTRAGRGPASVTVTRGSAPIGTTPFFAFEEAPTTTAARLSRADIWSGTGVETCRRTDAAAGDACLLDAMRRTGATPAAIAFTKMLTDADSPGYISGWRHAGPIGIATITYPYRANTNEGSALVPTGSDPVFIDRWEPSPADKARADWRRFAKAHPQSGAFPPGEIAVAKIVPGRAFAIRVRTRMADCHACEATGDQVVRYDFDPAGHLLRSALESVG